MVVWGQPHAQTASTPRKDPVPILQEAGWAPGPVSMGGKSRPHRDSIPDRPARSSVPVLTELPGPQVIIMVIIINRHLQGSYKFQIEDLSLYKLQYTYNIKYIKCVKCIISSI